LKSKELRYTIITKMPIKTKAEKAAYAREYYKKNKAKRLVKQARMLAYNQENKEQQRIDKARYYKSKPAMTDAQRIKYNTYCRTWRQNNVRKKKEEMEAKMAEARKEAEEARKEAKTKAISKKKISKTKLKYLSLEEQNERFAAGPLRALKDAQVEIERLLALLE
jgi:hypothetical protein